MKFSITIDVEKDLGMTEYFIGINEGLLPILKILNNYKIKATFFISGEIVEYLVKKGFLQKIINDGHELASHGYRHLDYRRWSLQQIEDEIYKSKERIEKLTGINVIGYRSPQFRVNEKIIGILKKIGFKYDSSIPEPGAISAASLLRNVKFSKNDVEKFQEKYIKEFLISSIPVIKLPHGLLWVNYIGFYFYKNFFKYFDNKIVKIFYFHPFDIIKSKERIKYNSFFQESCYKFRGDNLFKLLGKLLYFWKENNVEFYTLKEYYNSSF